MRHWLFHPLVFYPLLLLASALVVTISLKPQDWPRPAHAVAGDVVGNALVLQGGGFDGPADSPEQDFRVVRDFWGQPQTLKIAVHAQQPPPDPQDVGIQIHLTPDSAARLNNRAVRVEVEYRPVPVTAATGLSVRLLGAGPGAWVTQPIQPAPGLARFDLPAAQAVQGLGLRAMSDADTQAYGLEIVRIRLLPAGG